MAAAVQAFRVLLVDDNVHGLAARKVVLEEMGYEVSTAVCGEDGLRAFVEQPADIVVTDYKMPGMNGVELIAHIRAQRPNTPVIVLSGLVEALGLDEAGTGADVVISKSNTELSHLTRAVGRLLRRKLAKRPGRQTAASAKAQSV